MGKSAKTCKALTGKQHSRVNPSPTHIDYSVISARRKLSNTFPITTKHLKKQEPLYHTESKEPTSKKRDSQDLYTKSSNPVDYARFAQLRNKLRGSTRRLRACFEHNLARDLKSNSKAFWKYVRSRMKNYIEDQ